MFKTQIPPSYIERHRELSSVEGQVSEKVSLFREVYNLVRNEDLNELYIFWLDLFKKDSLPIAWLPGTDEFHTSNLSTLFNKAKAKDYNEVYNWSINNRSAYWEGVVQQLGIRFNNRYVSVLDGNPEHSVWFVRAMMNIAENCFLQSDETTAIVQGDENGKINKISYGDLKEGVNKVANSLSILGLMPGDSVVIYMPFTIESITAYLGIVKIGCFVVSVADSFSSSELAKRIETTKAKAIITCDGYIYGGKKIDILKKVHDAKAPTAIVANYIGSASIRSGDILFESLLDHTDVPYHYSVPDTTTNILFSSGTTKEPKAIPWTHLTPLKCAADGFYHLNIKEKDIVCWTTGMGWMMAPWLIYASLINKATIAIFTGAATSDSFGHFVENEKINVLGTIPSVVKSWKANNFHSKFNWSAIKVFSSTGEPSNQEDYFYLMSLAGFKAPVIEYCGGTEIGGGYITGSVLQPCSPGTFTTAALGLDFYLLDEDKKVAIGKPGEVFLVPPSIGLTNTLLNRDHHKEYYEGVPSGPNGEVLRKHGDAFETIEFLNTKFYKSIGRTDDAMNLGGIKISAVEIEEVVNRHPNIKDSAAISVPDKKGGPERLILFLDTTVSMEPEQLKKELQSLITKDLNPLFKIAELIERKRLPRTASNKLMRRELRKEYMDSMTH